MAIIGVGAYEGALLEKHQQGVWGAVPDAGAKIDFHITFVAVFGYISSLFSF